jgi:quercetin dioxygenase-like cupin family protein
MHPNGHEVTYVVEGEQTFYIEGVGPKVVKAGGAIYISQPRGIQGASSGAARITS